MNNPAHKGMFITKAAVLGSGSWGTALAQLLADNGVDVKLWARDIELVEQINASHTNSRYLPSFLLSENIHATNDLQYVCEGVELIVNAIPSNGCREVFRKIIPFILRSDTTEPLRIISSIKGIENSTLKTMVEVMREEISLQEKKFTPHRTVEIGVLSGPSFAKEVMERQPTAVTIGFDSLETARKMQSVFSNSYFRVYASSDVKGLELSGAVKNMLAIASGVADGLGYGHNTRAALICRGLAEMMRLGNALGAREETFAGLSGLGDLLLTSTGDLSRNRQVGLKLGRGEKLDHIIKEMKMVAEGIKSTKSIYDLARKKNINMPILEQVYSILYEDKECSLAVKDLLAREHVDE